MATNRLSDEDVERLGPKAKAQVKDATPMSAKAEPHRAPTRPAPASRPAGAPRKAPAARSGSSRASMARSPQKRAGAFLERTTSKVDKRVGGALAKHGRSVFVAEMVMAAFIIGISYVAANKTAPPPSKFIAAFTVYLVLGFVSEFGDGAQRFAAAFGGLFLLMLIMMHAKGIIAAMGFVTGLGGGETQGDPSPPPGPPEGTMQVMEAPAGSNRVPQLRSRGQVR